VLLSVREMETRKVTFNVTYQPGKIEFFDNKFRIATELNVTGTAELVGGIQEIRVRGHITGGLVGECDRCLEDALFPIDNDFDLTYVPAETDYGDAETDIPDEESEVGFYEGAGLELTDVLREQILLWLPMQWVCREDCKGICPVCGQNRNVVACSCQTRPVDDRWAALRDL
jgi:uncharacterized protein